MTRHIFAADFTPALSDSLLEWCLANGGSEFTITFLGEQGRPAPVTDQLESALAPASLGIAPRPVLEGPIGTGPTPPVPLWRLDHTTLALLAPLLPDGLFTYNLDMENGWLENLTIYRNSTLLLGVVTHEQEGILEVSMAEAAELSRLGIPTRDHGEWV